ncbi:hypothetical protein LDENG_00078560 [Lucifuga dentata]|nr:hypothetical protein LDENG_00078560 [Lucifuga dentata]
MDRDLAVVQGGFHLANKLCLPTSLSFLQKGDWSRVRKPILEAIRELCGQEELRSQPEMRGIGWKKKLVCALWLKLLSRETGEDMETAWRENSFFPIQNGFPELNYVVMVELVKSVGAAEIFAQFLLCLPQAQICTELERLVDYVRCSPTSDDDVQLFLKVWWELWKGKDEQKAGADDSIETVLTGQFVRLFSQPASLFPHAAKRLRLESNLLSAVSSPATDVLYVLLHGLKDMRDHISTTNLCFQALSISLDSLYTSFLIDRAVIVPTKEKMDFLSKVVTIREGNDEKLSPELLRGAQQDLRASHSPSQFQSSRMNVNQALKVIMELTQFWNNSGLLKMYDSSKSSYSAFKLHQSVQRVLKALEAVNVSETMTEMDDRNVLIEVLESLAFSATECSPEVKRKVTMMIINHHLDAYQDFAVLFASEKSWATSDEHWINCLKQNQASFQQHDMLIQLAYTLMSQLHSDTTNVGQCKKVIQVLVNIFSKLSLEDKNKALADMLRLSSRGFFGCSVPSDIIEEFEQELNLAFNCIIQPGGGAPALDAAVSLVAKVAFQNPELTLKSCCHLAVFNKGAFSLVANILQQLPGLRGREGNEKAQTKADNKGVKEAMQSTDRSDLPSATSPLCKCLQEMIRTKLLSNHDKEQFLQFLGLLMMPAMVVEGEDRRQSFLSPQEVVSVFVLPNLSTIGHHSIDLDLSLRLLHSALSVGTRNQDPASSPDWVLGCSPFPLLYTLAHLLHQSLRCWEQPLKAIVHHWSMDTKELLMTVLTTLGQMVGVEVASNPSSWSRALFWLYSKMGELDWTVRFYLKPVWGEHFRNEVPSSLLTVCDLPKQEWSGLDLLQYGQGTGLLAWMECCFISDTLQSTMLSSLCLNKDQPDHVSMFSKGLLVALTQTLPLCSISQWSRLLRGLRELLIADKLHVPYSLEYVDYLPLLDLRGFSCELRLSVLLLRVFQLLCGSSCSHWLSVDGWTHVGRLYALAVREMMDSLRAKLLLSSVSPKATVSSSLKTSSCLSHRASEVPTDHLKDSKQVEEVCSTKSLTLQDSSTQSCSSKLSTTTAVSSADPQTEEIQTFPSQEVLFVLRQLFCHVHHVQVMMPQGQCEPLFLTSLKILSHYEAVLAAFPGSSSPLESNNTRHFFSSITDNLQNEEMKAVLQQKIAQLVSAAV